MFVGALCDQLGFHGDTNEDNIRGLKELLEGKQVPEESEEMYEPVEPLTIIKTQAQEMEKAIRDLGK